MQDSESLFPFLIFLNVDSYGMDNSSIHGRKPKVRHINLPLRSLASKHPFIWRLSKHLPCNSTMAAI
jgi:hypothetical protein